MNELMNAQFERSAEDFVRECQNASSDEVSKIIAGLTAIIEGNEETYESMKNQKWFERIWYGLTGKNKATVKEMQANKDKLTKYTVRILVKMNDLLDEHGECIRDLYMALAIVRKDLGSVVDEVKKLAVKLNEKIISIDNYYYLLNEIRNNKFDASSPLISLIEIMSLIDMRTANDTKKLIQIKETMEQVGFDFTKTVDISTYSNEIFSLPEESVGRILLFCQRFSCQSRFLAYTSSLMKNYFYLWESDKRIVRENGEAVKSALSRSSLDSDAHCVVNEMFNDLKEAIHETFDLIETQVEPIKPQVPANYYSAKTTKSVNVIVAGKTGSGKSTLINSIFGWNVAATGLGHSITTKTSKYCNDEDNINLYDTVGFQLDSAGNNRSIADIKDIIRTNQNCVLWYCVNSHANKYEDSVVKELYSLGIPMIIILTSSVYEDDQLETEVRETNSANGLSAVPVIPVLAKDYHYRDAVVPAFGLEELIDKTIDAMSFGVVR